MVRKASRKGTARTERRAVAAAVQEIEQARRQRDFVARSAGGAPPESAGYTEGSVLGRMMAGLREVDGRVAAVLYERDELVRAARSLGATWAEIGESLGGISAQAAQQLSARRATRRIGLPTTRRSQPHSG